MIAKACDSQSSQLFSLRNYFPFYGIYIIPHTRHTLQWLYSLLIYILYPTQDIHYSDCTHCLYILYPTQDIHYSDCTHCLYIYIIPHTRHTLQWLYSLLIYIYYTPHKTYTTVTVLIAYIYILYPTQDIHYSDCTHCLYIYYTPHKTYTTVTVLIAYIYIIPHTRHTLQWLYSLLYSLLIYIIPHTRHTLQWLLSLTLGSCTVGLITTIFYKKQKYFRKKWNVMESW